VATRNAHEGPGLRLEGLLDVARRRWVWLGAPAVLGSALGLTLALLLPPVFEAESILVVRAPERAGQAEPPDSQALVSQVRLLVTARDRLVALVDRFELYPELADGALEARVVAMQEAIEIEALPPAQADPRRPGQIESVRIAFRSGDPSVVAPVVNRLTQDFQARASEIAQTDADGSTEFLARQIDAKRLELDRIGVELAGYREVHRGELPEDLADNRAKRERDAAERTRVRGEIERTRAQLGAAEADLAELRGTGASPTPRARALERELRGLAEKGYAADSAEVLRARAELKALQDTVEDRQADQGDLPLALRKLEAEVGDLQARMRDLERELARLDTAIA